jgi:thiamine pyrophosphokinase
MNGRRIVIVTGGTLGSWVKQELRQDDLLVGSDKGAYFLLENGFTPDLAVGDFDSVTAEELTYIRSASKLFLPCDPVDKDYTDTELAFNWALQQQPAEIVLLGALGTRFDHSLANVHLLRKGLETGTRCKIVDDHNEIILLNQTTAIYKGSYTHISLLPLSIEVTGITLTGFQYPLQSATLRIGQSLGISNILLQEKGLIEIDSGYLLVIQSKDEPV